MPPTVIVCQFATMSPKERCEYCGDYKTGRTTYQHDVCIAFMHNNVEAAKEKAISSGFTDAKVKEENLKAYDEAQRRLHLACGNEWMLNFNKRRKAKV